MKKISIVLPTYNEEAVINSFWGELKNVLAKQEQEYVFEILFVNDGSSDDTFELLRDASSNDSRIKIINLRQNYGHQTAMSAGLDIATGDAVITMDTDLQDPPQFIPQMLKKWKEGSEVISARRIGRKDGLFKDFSAKIFYKIMHAVSHGHIVENIADFRLMDRSVVSELNQNAGAKRFIRGFVSKLKVKQSYVDYNRPQRKAGKSKYSLIKMLKLALDGLKMELLLSQNALKPIQYKVSTIYQKGTRID